MLSALRSLFSEFRPVLRYAPRYRKALALGALAIPFSRALDLLIPWIVGRTVDGLQSGALLLSLPATFALLLALAALRGALRFCMRHQLVGASRRIERDFRADLYGHVLSLPPDWFRGVRSGDLMARMVWDVEAVRVFLGPGLMYAAETLFMLPAVFVLLRIDPLLTSLVLVPLVLIVAAMRRFAPRIHEAATRSQETLSDLSSTAQENFAGIRVVRSFAREPAEIARFAGVSALYRDRSIELARLRGANWTWLLAAKDLGMLVLVVAGCARLAAGRITMGDLWLFVLYVGLLFWPMVALGWMAGMAQRARASMRRLSEILDTKPDPGEAAPRRAPPPEGTDVRFEGVIVRRGGRRVLGPIDLEVPEGTILGVTGPTGSGKSTLAQLLPRLIEPSAGRVLVGGTDLAEVSLEAWRARLGYVPQEPFLFADTIRRNVLLGREADDETVRRALADAGVLDEVEALPDGLDTVVGERGVTLSGGQRQRIALARALAADPPILVLDDALAAVDADKEAEILARLAERLRGRTAIVVSHRPTALLLCHRVVVLASGRIAQEGPPGELSARPGPFRDAWLLLREAP